MREDKIRLSSWIATLAIVVVFIAQALVLWLQQGQQALTANWANAPLAAEAALAAACLLWASRREAAVGAQTPLVRGWAVLSAALLCFSLGNLYGVLNASAAKGMPFPSLADVFFLLFYGLFFVALLLLPENPLSRRELPRMFLDMELVALAVLLTYWYFVVGPGGAAALADPPTLVLLAYALMGLMVVYTAIAVLQRHGSAGSRQPMIALVACGVLIMAGHTVHNFQQVRTAQPVNGGVALFYVAGVLAACVAGLGKVGSARPALIGADVDDGDDSLRSERVSLGLTYALLVVAWLFLIWRRPVTAATGGLTEFAMSGAMIAVLAMVRQIMLWNDNVHLAHRLRRELDERRRNADINATMARLGGALLSASSFEDVCGQVLGEAKRLTASPSGLVGYVDAQTGRMIVPATAVTAGNSSAANGANGSSESSSSLWEWVAQNHEPILANDPWRDPRTSEDSSQRTTIERFLGVPALVGAELVGQIVVIDSSRDYRQDDLLLLERMAAIYALAVRQLSLAQARLRARDELEVKVQERTAELVRVNDELRREATERERAQRALRESEALYRRLVETSPDGIVLADLRGSIVVCNDNLAQLAGYERVQDLIGRNVLDLAVGRRRHDLTTFARRILVEGSVRDVEIMVTRKDGTLGYASLNASLCADEQGKPAAVIGVLRDITERKQAEDKLRHASTHDALTGAYNRAFFDDELKRLEREGIFPVSILVLDVDQFKRINDMHGHAEGDQMLRRAVALMKRSFRAEDIVARIGGDEFAVVLEGADVSAAQGAVQRLRDNLIVANLTHDRLPMGLSIGAATAVRGATLTAALHRADARMYADKLGHGTATEARAAQSAGDIDD